MTGRLVMLLVTILSVVALTFTIAAKPVPRFVWNASPSVPIGLYSVEPFGKLAVTNMVVATPPKLLAYFLAERGHLPIGVPLIKRVLALPGQTVCRNELLITVNGIDMGAALERDSHDRPLPSWQGCLIIGPGEVFLMNWDEPSSFDGRYFGLIPSSSIVGRALPVWTFEQR